LIVGIDLGTTNSAIAALSTDGPQLIPNAIGKLLTPSAVAIDASGQVLVGQPAKDHQVLHPESSATCFKRHMGSDWTVKLRKHEFDAVKLSSFVLTSLKEDAQDFLQLEVTRAVITVPAYFHDQQRHATIEAGRMAGLTVERIINEPTAASLAYGVHEKEADKTVAVFDLGGGTFDISVVDFFEGCIEVRSSAGEAILGGEDFSRAIARTILTQQGTLFETAELKDPARVSRLIQQCEIAKRELSSRDSTRVRLPGKGGTIAPDSAQHFVIDREFLSSACEPLFAKIEKPVRRALGDAGLTPDQIDEVILVGGATRMPAIVDRVQTIFSRQPMGSLNPDHVVAAGAAIQAGLIERNAAVEDTVVVDVAPFTLGVEISKELGHQQKGGYFLPIIDRNTVIPASRAHRVSTVHPNQEQVSVKVFQGESRLVKDNILLGTLEVKRIPRGPAGQVIEIRFTYDANGVLEVETTVVATQEVSQLILTNQKSSMTKSEIDSAIAAMQKLKTPPREEAANRFALKRAERLYQELHVGLRNQLERLVDHFEDTLEKQDPAEIEMARDQLLSFLAVHDRDDLPELD
jgi:molecular chaperone HscC